MMRCLGYFNKPTVATVELSANRDFNTERGRRDIAVSKPLAFSLPAIYFVSTSNLSMYIQRHRCCHPALPFSPTYFLIPNWGGYFQRCIPQAAKLAPSDFQARRL